MIDKAKIKKIIEFLCQCDEHDIYWLSEVFDDISEVLQSKKFIETIKNLQTKYPNVNIEPDIFFAELALQQNNSDKGNEERDERI